jgi:hypothetical protein
MDILFLQFVFIDYYVLNACIRLCLLLNLRGFERLREAMFDELSNGICKRPFTMFLAVAWTKLNMMISTGTYTFR